MQGKQIAISLLTAPIKICIKIQRTYAPHLRRSQDTRDALTLRSF